MDKNIAIIGLIITMISSCVQKKEQHKNNKKTDNLSEKIINYKSNINREETKKILYDLSSDNFEGREPGTEGYRKSEAYVINYLKDNGIKPLFKTYKHQVPHEQITSNNIVGLIGNKNNTKPHIIICAHLDHLGKSNNKQDSIYNGANDNASGVTAVLQIAKELKKHSFTKNIIIALFTLEEKGLHGSKALAKTLKKQHYNIDYVVNFEMIGKTKSTGKNKVYITGHKKSDLAKQMNQIANRTFVEYLPEAEKFNLFEHSDNYSFYKEFEIPSHTISTFDFLNYKHYHKESDESSLLDIDNTNDIINSSASIIYTLLKKDIKITEK